MVARAKATRNILKDSVILIDNGYEYRFLRTITAVAKYIGCTKQLVSQVLNPERPQFKSAKGWSITYVKTSEVPSKSTIIEEA